jgi:hypothetical protein
LIKTPGMAIASMAMSQLLSIFLKLGIANEIDEND